MDPVNVVFGVIALLFFTPLVLIMLYIMMDGLVKLITDKSIDERLKEKEERLQNYNKLKKILNKQQLKEIQKYEITQATYILTNTLIDEILKRSVLKDNKVDLTSRFKGSMISIDNFGKLLLPYSKENSLDDYKKLSYEDIYELNECLINHLIQNIEKNNKQMDKLNGMLGR